MCMYLFPPRCVNTTDLFTAFKSAENVDAEELTMKVDADNVEPEHVEPGSSHYDDVDHTFHSEDDDEPDEPDEGTENESPAPLSQNELVHAALAQIDVS